MGTDKGRTVPWPFCLILADEKLADGSGVSSADRGQTSSGLLAVQNKAKTQVGATRFDCATSTSRTNPRPNAPAPPKSRFSSKKMALFG